MTRRLNPPMEKLLRDMLDGMAETGGFATDVRTMRDLLAEIDWLRGELGMPVARAERVEIVAPYGVRADGTPRELGDLL